MINATKKLFGGRGQVGAAIAAAMILLRGLGRGENATQANGRTVMNRGRIAIIFAGVLGVVAVALVLVAVLHGLDGRARAQPEPLQDPTFSISRASAQAPVPFDAADILTLSPGAVPPPVVAWPCAAMGLGFCGGSDDVNSGSLGQDFTLSPPDPDNPTAWLYFSVAPGATGVGGTGVNNETVGCTPEPEADEFGSAATGSNYQLFDGDGVASCNNPAAAPLGLLEPTGDDLDAIDPLRFTPPAPGNPGYATLDQTSPSVPFGPGGPYSAADIFVDTGAGFFMYASAPALGLDLMGLNTDDIDALCLFDDGDYQYNPGVDIVWFSLTAGSMSLGVNSPADIFAAPYTGVPVITAGQLGLGPDDELNALKCYEQPEADLEKLDLYVKPFYCGDSDMDGDEATGLPVAPGTGTCCDGVDNDGNTTTDGRDPKCVPHINEDPVDDDDNDGDGWVDEDPPSYPSLPQTCPWNGDDDCDGDVDEDPKNGLDDDGNNGIDEDPANGFLGIDWDSDGWVDEDGAGRFDFNGNTVIDDCVGVPPDRFCEEQTVAVDDDGDTDVDEDSLDSPVGEPGLAHQPHYLVKELLINNGPAASVLAQDTKEIDAPSARFFDLEDNRRTCNDGLDNDSGPCDDDKDNDRDGTCDWDGCNGMPADSDCTAPTDTEGDGLIDGEDPECLEVHVWEEAVGLNACNDGLDNSEVYGWPPGGPPDGDIDEDDNSCETTTEVSVEITDLAAVVSVKEGVSAYVKVRDPVHGNKCQPPRIALDAPHNLGPYERAASLLTYNSGAHVAVGDCIAVDSAEQVVKELDLHQQVELLIDVPVLKEHQFDLACEGNTSNHKFTIQNQIQPPEPVTDPIPGNNELEMEMLVACLAFTDGELQDLVVPDDTPPLPPNTWDVDVSTSYIWPVSVDAINNGPVPVTFNLYFKQTSPGLGIEGDPDYGELADTDGDRWADNVEVTLGSNPNEAGSTPESMYAGPNPCSDGVDNDGFLGMDLGDPKCSDKDKDRHPDAMESLLHSDPLDRTSTPESMQFPWTCGDGVDNDGDTKCDNGDCEGPVAYDPEGDDDANGWGDCTIGQLKGVRPPVTCASGWIPEHDDGTPETPPRLTGDENMGISVWGKGTLVVSLVAHLPNLPEDTTEYDFSRDLVFHCFAPASPYPEETIRPLILAQGAHVYDLNADNNWVKDTFDGNATCPGGEADLKLLSWDFTPPVPDPFYVTQEHVFTTTKTIHNNGPTAAAVLVQKSMNVPVDCDGSLHVSYAGETVVVAANTLYKVDDGPWTPGPAELSPAVSQTVYVQGSALIHPEDNELEAWFDLAALDVPVSVDVEVEENFDIKCHQPGSYSFEFGNHIGLAAYPNVCDPSMGDFSLDLTKDVDVELGCETGLDTDGDTFNDEIEWYLPTDCTDDCADGPTDDAWPLDMDMNTVINLTGDAMKYVGKIGCVVATNPECKRLDLDMNGVINLTGDAMMYVGRIGESCA